MDGVPRCLTCKYLLAYIRGTKSAMFPMILKSLLETGKGAPDPDDAKIDNWNEALPLDIDKVFKALADPGRRRLLDLLHRDNGQTLTALCEHMDMSRQAVTQHLQLLEEANLVAIVWQGREKLHYLNPVPLHEIHERWIGKFERNRLGALRDLKKKLEGDDDEKA